MIEILLKKNHEHFAFLQNDMFILVSMCRYPITIDAVYIM